MDAIERAHGYRNDFRHHEESRAYRIRIAALSWLCRRSRPGTQITVHTRNTCYRMEVMDGSARRVMISGGLLFPQGAEVEVIGATDDEGVRVGWIVEGLQLELSTVRGPVLTSIVESLSVRQTRRLAQRRASTSADTLVIITAGSVSAES